MSMQGRSDGLTNQMMLEHDQTFQATGDKYISGKKVDKNPEHLKTQGKSGHTRVGSQTGIDVIGGKKKKMIDRD